MTAAVIQPTEDRTIPTDDVGKIEANYYCRGWNAKRKKYCGLRAGFRTAHPGVGRCMVHGGQRISNDKRVTTGLHSAIRTDRVRSLIDQHLKDANPLDVSVTLATAKALMDDYIERYYTILEQLEAWYATTTPLTEDKKLALLRSLEELENLYGNEPTPRQTEDLALARAAVEHLAAPRAEKPRQLLDISDAVRHADTISKIIHRVNLHHSQSAVSYARLATFMFELNRELDVMIPDREQLRKINERILQIRI